MSRLPDWIGLVSTGTGTSLKSLFGFLKILVGFLFLPIKPLVDFATKKPEAPDSLTKADKKDKSKINQQVAFPESVNFHFTRCSPAVISSCFLAIKCTNQLP